MVILDIETIAQPGLEDRCPVFKPAANLKDPEKIKASIEEKRAAWINEAALHADRGMVALIGKKHSNIRGVSINSIDGYTEESLLESFWLSVKNYQDETFVGFNIHRFDLPFLVRRSMLLGIPYPKGLIFGGRGYIEAFRWVDLLTEWQCGDRQEFISLDNLAQAFGHKPKETSGAEFGKLWIEDREKAVQHLKDDLEITDFVAHKMGFK